MANNNDADLFRVEGQVAIITGAGSGLGRMMAHSLASNGAQKVYVVGRRLEKLQDTASGYENIVPIVGDATRKDSLQAVADQVKAEVGHVNVLIVNSGSSGPGMNSIPSDAPIKDVQQNLWSISEDDMNKVYAINNTGAYFTAVAFLELLDAGNKSAARTGIQSQIIFTASLAGYARALSTNVPYSTSKAATIHLVKLLSTYLAKHDIRVNGVAPGIYPSEMTEGMTDRPGFNVNTIPAHRLGTEEDMRGTILFLTSRAGAYTNGLVLISDGGRLGQMPATY
ncbi:Short-chain dehydrogenase/reductase SAT3 [Fulvia fulva]|uniref:Short-chain dehydrogenase/reductase SAT3 n=1 Tax=Passalora fulva TaxID=5499 RepID=A0A9Q8PF84_PASFU|nr:Short-chain dehydrogenase/reductase SAT3 [Fulvia fulva]KAK4618063.1 Short-chain dehydrogenase/reductase SAT3 [Fulvia fulva]KAK4618524.1 Short-chain dehydrogenase/reductase SAT3 [Fulvia fulva]UJO21335.1 Short-chain dehydrogenase/reductase SAT3 [Fulvia fulva]WPV18486.1 Short-chain dehydrogenase/reductase SAT3 [Fulvia fulva]WPV32767.1 Short-chain dehydrogenase/reductase SAT3 [Fulvia fulva]